MMQGTIFISSIKMKPSKALDSGSSVNIAMENSIIATNENNNDAQIGLLSPSILSTSTPNSKERQAAFVANSLA